ncbi:hypothetical protein Pogu_1864 [Pyrobaculum oguniense TE7]|uniref:Uncharacterized protein n=1 Tax=Pyrobaculum oguniense (strain DSM 13380 / JCM 10595 / TE7) TaxID=698757 RepID=H6QAW8_PYROT|nr:hypothetical protein Pogu_1864 [Pyrobaculum oguniense TE7]
MEKNSIRIGKLPIEVVEKIPTPEDVFKLKENWNQRAFACFIRLSINSAWRKYW